MQRFFVLRMAGLVAPALVGLLVATTASAQSFSVAPGGPSGLASEFIYKNAGGVPTPIGGGPMSGIGPGDAIDGFSDNKALTEFLLCFSVDAASVGALPPTVFGPNVEDQGASGKEQAAGDAFLTTEEFTRGGISGGLGLFNNVLVINQSPIYINDFGLLPLASPGVAVGGVPLDDVVGGGPPPPPMITDLYFTLDTASPALTGSFAGFSTPSGADVFFDPTPDIVLGLAGDEGPFALALALGLLPTDEVDALVVFDDDDDGEFSGTDQVLFSLAAGSPSLIVLGASPADVLSITFGGVLGVYATAADLGLKPDDELNMLELVPLVDGSALATIEAKVPEPSTGLLLVCGLLGLSLRRRGAD